MHRESGGVGGEERGGKGKLGRLGPVAASVYWVFVCQQHHTHPNPPRQEEAPSCTQVVEATPHTPRKEAPSGGSLVHPGGGGSSTYTQAGGGS